MSASTKKKIFGSEGDGGLFEYRVLIRVGQISETYLFWVFLFLRLMQSPVRRKDRRGKKPDVVAVGLVAPMPFRVVIAAEAGVGL